MFLIRSSYLLDGEVKEVFVDFVEVARITGTEIKFCLLVGFITAVYERSVL